MGKNNLRLGLVAIGITGMLMLLKGISPGAIAGDVPENLALHGTASVSSVHEGGLDYNNATELNNGMYGPSYSWIGGLSDYVDPKTQKQFPHRDSWWAQIDLGVVTQVGAVAFGGETPGRTPKDFTIQVSTDGAIYTDWVKITGRADPARVLYEKDEPVSARYVKIVITDIQGTRNQGYSPGIDEIEIYKNKAEAIIAAEHLKSSTSQGTDTVSISPSPANSAKQPEVSLLRETATIIIAASDSLPQSKANATYVCDGTDDHVEIQRAIDTLPEAKGKETWHSIGGGSIQLLEGTFHIGATIKFYDKPVSLIGTGRYSTALVLQKEVNDDMILIGTGKAQGIPAGRISHMTLEGASGFQTKGSGIRMKSGDMMVIEDVRVYDFKEHGIFLDGTSPEIKPCVGLIEKCRIEYNKKNGIYLGPGTEGWMIRGNWIGDNGTMGQEYHGIYIQALHGVPAGRRQPGGASNSHIITGNEIWQNKSTQISVNGGAHIMITSNMILSSPYENIKIYGGADMVTITDNCIHSASEVEIGGAPHITLSNASHVVIANNAISSPSRGLPSAAMAEAGAKPGEVINMPAPSAILIEKEGSDYNKFIGNVIQGDVTKVILVGAHSYTDSREEQDKK